MKISRLITGVAACALVALAAACDRTPDGVIPQGEMASLMADIHTAESVVDTERRTFATDSMRLVLKQSVLAEHGYDVATFDSSLMYYGKNIDLYAKLYDDVVEILEKRIADTEASAATDGSSAAIASGEINISADGDSVDVWGLPRAIAFSNASAVRTVPFGISTDRYWEKGDSYILRGRMTGSADALTLALAVEYMDGSVEHLTIRAMGDGWKTVTLDTDTARIARYVYGAITGPAPSAAASRTGRAAPAMLDSITLYRTRYVPGKFRDPRMHNVGPR